MIVDPRLNGASYPVHQHARHTPYHNMFNPLWTPRGVPTQLPFIYPPQMNPAEIEAANKTVNGKSKASDNKSPSPNKMISPSQKSFSSNVSSEKASKAGGKGAPPVGYPPFVPYPAANASISLAQTKSELSEKTKKLQEKEDEGT